MHFYTLNSQNPSKLYLWEVEDVAIQEELYPHLSDIKSPFYWVFEELRLYPNNQVVFAKALIPHNNHITGFRLMKLLLLILVLISIILIKI